MIDKVGYLPLAAEAAAALFQVISQRYGRGSIVLTTNLAVGEVGPHLHRPALRRRRR